MDIVILGLSITSSWGNGHATTFRGLVRHLHAQGHRVLFLERDVPWYAENRDLPNPPFGRTELYGSLEEAADRFAEDVRLADAVIVGSYVPDGIALSDWVLRTAGGVAAFYDIDTPVTIAQLEGGRCPYLQASQIAEFDLYLSFTGGPMLQRLEREFGSSAARALYCSVDPDLYYPEEVTRDWQFGYMGTYSDDRQPVLERLLLEPARRLPEKRFIVAGPQYPPDTAWPPNVDRIEHVPPAEHRRFYNRSRFTLNVTRAEMVRAGYSPSVRLFEAAACGVPIITDTWDGLESFFEPTTEILPVRDANDVITVLRNTSASEAHAIGQRARARVLSAHTAAHRAAELVEALREVADPRRAAAS